VTEAQQTKLRRRDLTGVVLGAAIEVHKKLGPGLLESAYDAYLCHELSLRGIKFERQVPLRLVLEGVEVPCGYRLDFVIEREVVIELKAVDILMPIHETQLLTYLRLGGFRVGLLINFNVRRLKDGIIRRVL
jgi:GxxExxY protein